MWTWRKGGDRSKEQVANSGLGHALPDGVRIYSIGDIHGSARELNVLLERITQDLKERPIAQAEIVLHGDYVDRGPQSADVLTRLALGQFPAPTTTLRGNHEEMLLNFVSDPTSLASWRHVGGLETLHSFGIDVSAIGSVRSTEQYSEVHGHFLRALGDARLKAVEETLLSYSVGGYFFCHAGIRPGVALERQQPRDLLWIRDEFLSSGANHGKVVVHGHTPVEEAENRGNRINVDTGAYLTGTLTAAVLEANSVIFIAT